jgi:hypothetical protein
MSLRISITSPLSQPREKSSCPVFTKCGEPYLIQHYVIKIVSYLWQVDKILNIKPCVGKISGTWELISREYWRKSMIIGVKNTDLQWLIRWLKLHLFGGDCILFKIVVQHVCFVKGRGTCRIRERKVTILLAFLNVTENFHYFPLKSMIIGVKNTDLQWLIRWLKLHLFGGNDFNETRAEKLPTSPGLVSPDQVHFPRSGNQAWVIVCLI